MAKEEESIGEKESERAPGSDGVAEEEGVEEDGISKPWSLEA